MRKLTHHGMLISGGGSSECAYLVYALCGLTGALVGFGLSGISGALWGASAGTSLCAITCPLS